MLALQVVQRYQVQALRPTKFTARTIYLNNSPFLTCSNYKCFFITLSRSFCAFSRKSSPMAVRLLFLRTSVWCWLPVEFVAHKAAYGNRLFKKKHFISSCNLRGTLMEREEVPILELSSGSFVRDIFRSSAKLSYFEKDK